VALTANPQAKGSIRLTSQKVGCCYAGIDSPKKLPRVEGPSEPR
jgi:hypothetical protein